MALLEKQLTTPSPRAEFLGCFFTDIGPINRILILHRGASVEALHEEARSGLFTSRELSDMVREIATDYFQLFPGIPEIVPGNYGPVFDIRTYTLRPHGLGETQTVWRHAIPERTKLSQLVGVMASVSGPGPRILQIWPYRTVQDRFDIRKQAQQAGIWPPKGGLDRLAKTQSELYFAAPFSPIY